MGRQRLLAFVILFLGCTVMAYSQKRTEFTSPVTLLLTTGETELELCGEDELPDMLSFRIKPFFIPYAFIVTDTDNIIQFVSEERDIDFETLPAGSYRVWGLLYKRTILAEPGMDILTDTLADHLYGLTDNFISINNIDPDGGQLLTQTGESSVLLCPDDNNPDVVAYTNTSTAAPSYTYAITDTEGTVLDISQEETYDFDGLPEGDYQIWGYAYLGASTLNIGDNIATAALSDACFDLSDAPVNVTIATPFAGEILLTDGTSSLNSCDGSTTVLEFTAAQKAVTPFVYLLTDEQGTIVQTLDVSTFSTETLESGLYRFYGLSYTGALQTEGATINDAALSDDCFALSTNSVELVVQDLQAGTLSFAGGADTQTLCVQDGATTTIDVLVDGNDQEGEYAFVITDENNRIELVSEQPAIDLGSLGAGTYRVYGLSYTGDILLEAGDVLFTSNASSICEGITEDFIEVRKIDLEAGSIAYADGTDTSLQCFDAALPEAVTFTNLALAEGVNALVFADENDNVLQVSEDFSLAVTEELPASVRIYGLTFTGKLTSETGGPLSATGSSECFDLTDNFVTWSWQQVDGSTVRLEDGSRSIEICVQDEIENELVFVTTSEVAANYAYVLTDEQDRIRFALTGNAINFDVDGPGESRVWGVSYQGDLNIQAGTLVSEQNFSDVCFDVSDNFVRIIKQRVDGGNISLADGTTETVICGEGQPDILTFVNTSNGSAGYGLIITNTNNTILKVVEADSVNFDEVAATESRVWGLSYSGVLAADLVGKSITGTAFTDGCYALSADFVSVEKVSPRGGTITFLDGTTTQFACPDDERTILRFDLFNAQGDDYRYLITDENNIILATTDQDTFDLSSFDAGIYRAWGLSFTGTLSAEAGKNAGTAALSDDCYDLSDNFLIINRELPLGGRIETSTQDTVLTICPGAGQLDSLFYSVTGNTNGALQYLLTDSDNIILDILDKDTLVMDTFPEGTYRLWGLTYNGAILATVGNSALEPLAEGCFALSDNYIEINSVSPVGGSISIDGGTVDNICTGDGTADEVSFTISGSAGPSYTVLVVNEADELLFTLGDSLNYNFDETFGGNLKIYGLAYTGVFTAAAGDTITQVALSDDCFSLSDNFISILRDEVDGGTIATAAGVSDVAYVCAGDNVPDALSFENTSSSNNMNYRYVITNNNDIVQRVIDGNTFDFDINGISSLRVYGVSFTGNFQAAFGNPLFETALSTACFDISDNFVQVVRDEPAVGKLRTNLGDEDVLFCPGADGDTLQLSWTGNSNSGVLYILTDEERVVLQTTTNPSLNMQELEEGLNYQIFAVSYTGNPLVMTGDTLDLNSALADNCFVPADNSITLEKGGAVEGGRIFSPSGQDVFYACPNDTIADIVLVSTENNGISTDSYSFIITDSRDRVQFAPFANPVIDFRTARPDVYRIYGVSHAGPLTAQSGRSVFDPSLSNACFDVSDNFLTVVVDAPSAGMVMTEEGETLVNTVNDDEVIDSIRLTNTSFSFAQYAYLLADEEGVIQSILPANIILPDTLEVGTYQLHGLSYSGSLTAEIGVALDTAMLADNCFELSENFVTLNVNAVGGAPQTNEVHNTIIASHLPVAMSPNPAISVVQLNFNLDVQTTVVLEIVEMSGRVVMREKLAASKGENRTTLNINELTQGFYIVRMQGGEQFGTTKFFKATE